MKMSELEQKINELLPSKTRCDVFSQEGGTVVSLVTTHGNVSMQYSVAFVIGNEMVRNDERLKSFDNKILLLINEYTDTPIDERF